MAYRVKGIYTKRQREQIIKFIKSYYALTSSNEVGVATKAVCEVFRPFVLLAVMALYIDEEAIMRKCIERAR